jgi:hypothetical protein
MPCVGSTVLDDSISGAAAFTKGTPDVSYSLSARSLVVLLMVGTARTVVEQVLESESLSLGVATRERWNG